MTRADNTITIYSGQHQGHLDQNQLQNVRHIPGYAVVKQYREVAFKKGTFQLAYDDVAAHIDPTTVSFSTPNNPNVAAVLEQNFQFDLVSTEQLLNRYLEQTITVIHGPDSQHQTTGVLLSTAGGMTLQLDNDQVISIQQWQHIEFPELPGGLLTKPTLVWLLESLSSRTETIAMSYQTRGMTWWADYNVILHEGPDQSCTLDLSSWVSIVNKSGASFHDTRLKLIAGDVNRAPTNQPVRQVAREALVQAAGTADFSEQALFEYHLYKLPRTIDLPNNSTKQIQLLNHTNGVHCERTLVFNGSGQHHINYHRPITDSGYLRRTDAKVAAWLSFKNAANNHLGMPLPAGRVRVNMLDPDDGSVEFIGEDRIDHTPKNDTIELKLGHAFDVQGSRQQLHFERGKNSLTEQLAVTINNQKDRPQKVTIIEPLYRWSNWQITQHNEQYEKIDASTIQFTIEVPADSEKTVEYTVLYQWPDQQP
ncbi:DUF4139 domain-containing protein [Marinicella meishanensis]|uniref:DUF4139 domain-containing protein n=1 Tax=Marinicella meishanensis TaxID=2873263 RepID=UPI001CC139D2|nr:DUF4139 domain-containing protein [Marinicella sp. NBU2979]